MLVLTFEPQFLTIDTFVFKDTGKIYKDLAKARKIKTGGYKPEFVKTLYEDENCYVVRVNDYYYAGVNVANVTVRHLVEKVESLGIGGRFFDIN